MASIQTSIMIRDGMSVAFEHMNKAMNLTLNTFESVHKATLSAMDTSSIQAARESIAQATVSMQNYERETAQAAAQQQVFTNRARESVNVAGELWSKVRGIAATIGGMRALGQVVGLSDEMTQTKARLSMVVDDGGSVQALQQDIFASAQRARADYMGVADVVAKLSLRAGDAFGSNAETIRFAENLNKVFAIDGSPQEEMYSASLQLTQALGSGVLRGEEFNAVFEAAPHVIQTIADYLEVPIGNIKDMASEGQITSEIVKNSMLSATDAINRQFETMPITWGQVWTTMKNEAVVAFDPVLQKISDLANAPELEQMRTNVTAAVTEIASAVVDAFTAVGNIASFVYQNWSILAPIIYTVVAAFMAYKVAMMIVTVAQNLFNISLNACPIFIIITMIALVIGWIYNWVQSVGGLEIAWAICMDYLLLVWDGLRVAGMVWFDFFCSGMANLQNAVFTAVFWIQDRLSQMAVMWNTIGTSIVNFVGDMKVNVLMILQNMINGAIGLINDFISLLNNIPGVSIKAINEVTFGAEAAAQNEAEKQARNADLANYASSQEAERQERAQRLSAMQAQADTDHAKRLADIQNAARQAVTDHQQRQADIAARQAENAKKPGAELELDGAGQNVQAPPYDGTGGLGTNLDDIYNTTGDTAYNTAQMADSLDASEEELKLLREIAERQAINKFTTAKVVLDFTGMTNKIEGSEDLDGLVDRLAVRLEDVLYTVAEGVQI